MFKPTTHVRDLGVMIDNDLVIAMSVMSTTSHEHAFTTCVNYVSIRRTLTVDKLIL